MRSPPPSSAIRPAWSGTPRRRCRCYRLLPGLYPTAVARLLRGLALAGQARDADADERGGLLAELDEVTRWLAARAADAPDNFLHLLRLVEAERAWAAGDFRAAVLAFDAARREAAQRQRPWHRALIAERAARFYLAHGVEHAGYDLLAQARQEYLAWGATAKVAQLDWAYPALRPPSDPAATAGDQPADLPHRRAAVTTGTIDLLGILSASQALSSETSIDRLHARVVQVLSAMTGATGVHLLLWSEDRQDWLLPAPGGGSVPVSGTGHDARCRCRCCATSSGRVSRWSWPTPPAMTGSPATPTSPTPTAARCWPCRSSAAARCGRCCCWRTASSAPRSPTERLDAVKLIAGQLAVSLDNAQLYAEFRRIADEQAALRRVATLVARGGAPEEVFAAVAEEVGALLGGRHRDPGALDRAGRARSTAVDQHGRAAPTPVGGAAAARPPERARAGVQAGPAGADRRRRDDLWRDRPGGHARLGAPLRGRQRRSRSRAGCGARSSPASRRGAAAGRHRGSGWPSSPSSSPPPSPTPKAQAELTTSRARIVAAADQARRRIERDLHDGAQQRLVSLALQLRAARAAVPPELGGATRPTPSPRRPARWTSCARSPAASTRPSWPKGGLDAALKALARRSPVPVDLQVRAGRAAARAGRGQRLLRRRRGADQRGQARARLGRHRRGRGRRRRPARRGPRRRRRRRRLRPRHRPGRPQGPRGGARRPDLSRQPARGRDQPARGAPAHRHERRRHLPLARAETPRDDRDSARLVGTRLVLRSSATDDIPRNSAATRALATAIGVDIYSPILPSRPLTVRRVSVSPGQVEPASPGWSDSGSQG